VSPLAPVIDTGVVVAVDRLSPVVPEFVALDREVDEPELPDEAVGEAVT